MSLSRLWTRLTRVEQQASQLYRYADVLTLLGDVARKAGRAVGLAPAVVQGMCTVLHDTLRTLGKRFPRRFTDEQSLEDMITHALTALLDVLAAHVVDPSTRQRLETQIAEEFRAHVEAEKRAAAG